MSGQYQERYEYFKQYREKNNERLQQKRHEYYEENKDKLQEQTKQWKQDNPFTVRVQKQEQLEKKRNPFTQAKDVTQHPEYTHTIHYTN